MPPPPEAALPLPEACVAGLAVVALFYAWRGLAPVPLLPRLLLGLLLGIAVPVSFGLTVMALSPYGFRHGAVEAISAAAPTAVAPVAPIASTDVAGADLAAPGGSLRVGPSDGEASPEPGSASPNVASAVEPSPAKPPTITPPAASAHAETEPAEPAASEPIPDAVQLVAPATAADGVGTPASAVAPAAKSGDGAIAGDVLYFAISRFGAAAYDGHPGRSQEQHLEFGSARLAAATAGPRPGPERPAQASSPIAEVTALTGAEFKQRVTEMRRGLAASPTPAPVVVLVHGYNTSLDGALAQGEAVAASLQGVASVFVYNWPSAAAIPSYSFDRRAAAATSSNFAEFISALSETVAGAAISIVAIDIGAEPVLSALQSLSARVPIAELVLVAPDVQENGLGERLAGIAAPGTHVTLYAMRGARALDVSRRYHGGVARAGEPRTGGPLTIAGVESIAVDAGAARPAAFGPGATLLLADIAAMISTGRRATGRSNTLLPAVDKTGAAYWRLSAAPH